MRIINAIFMFQQAFWNNVLMLNRILMCRKNVYWIYTLLSGLELNMGTEQVHCSFCSINPQRLQSVMSWIEVRNSKPFETQQILDPKSVENFLKLELWRKSLGVRSYKTTDNAFSTFNMLHVNIKKSAVVSHMECYKDYKLLTMHSHFQINDCCIVTAVPNT